MPVLTLTCVGATPDDVTQRLADRLGAFWDSEPGRIWVRLMHLAPEAAAPTHVVAQVLARPVERVHRDYAPAARGRQWFGGVAVR